MKNTCTACDFYSTCELLCDDAEKIVHCDYVSMREQLRDKVVIELTPTSKAFTTPEAGFSDFDFLSDKENLILEMFYSSGFSYQEIADRTNYTEGTVKTKLWRAKQKIKKHC